MKQNGYTLLELIVAMGIMGLLVISATALFFSSIRGGGKVDVTTEVKQNGQFALNTMEQLVRNSVGLAACSPSPQTSLTVTARDGAQLTFSCEDLGLETAHIASNSARLTSTSVVVTDCSFVCQPSSGSFAAPLVTMSFRLRQAGTGGAVAESATAEFSTAVSVRSF